MRIFPYPPLTPKEDPRDWLDRIKRIRAHNQRALRQRETFMKWLLVVVTLLALFAGSGWW